MSLLGATPVAVAQGTGAAGVFDNQGTVISSALAASLLPLQSSGSIQVTGGTLAVNGVRAAGVLQVATGAQLNFASGALRLGDGTQLLSAGGMFARAVGAALQIQAGDTV